MPPYSEIAYYIIFVIATALSFMATAQNLRGLSLLRGLLISGLINEFISDYLKSKSVNPNPGNHFYVAVEYILLSLFFVANSQGTKLNRFIVISIPLYLTTWVLLTIFYCHLSDYPSITYNISCFFTIIWAVMVMFTMEAKEGIKITALPFFWICSGIIIFYMGVFFYNAVYNSLLVEKTALAISLRRLINMNLNYLFYIVWSYAFICSIRLKKYSTRL